MVTVKGFFLNVSNDMEYLTFSMLYTLCHCTEK